MIDETTTTSQSAKLGPVLRGRGARPFGAGTPTGIRASIDFVVGAYPVSASLMASLGLGARGGGT